MSRRSVLLALLLAPTLAAAQPFDAPFIGLFTGEEVQSRFNVNATAADFNGDGRTDIAVARNVFAGGFTILLADGTGLYAPPAHYGPVAGGGGPLPLPGNNILGSWDLEPGDFDEDGDIDLVATNGETPNLFSTVSVWRNQGDGTFPALPDTIRVGEGGPLEVDAADFNEDGHLDLVVTRFGSYQQPSPVSVLLGDGTGGFAEPVEYPAFDGWADSYAEAADLDGDGHVDLAVGYAGSGQLAVLLGDGAGTFGATAYHDSAPSVLGLGGLALADIDNDGDIDAVAPGPFDQSAASGSLVVFRNDGTATFSSELVLFGVGSYIDRANDIVVDDFDGDGWVDVVGSVYGGSIAGAVLVGNDGAGGFLAAQRIPSVQNSFAIAAADADDDGDTDVVVVDRLAAFVAVHYNRGGLDLFVPPSVRVAPANRISLGDVDGDGDLDAATSITGGSFIGGGVRILRNAGDGTFATADSLEGRIVDARLRDLNGDGLADLLAAEQTDLVVAFAIGGGLFGDTTHVDLGACNRGMADAFDVDGDGDLDAVLGEARGCASNIELPRVLVALNDGTGAFGPPIASAFGARSFLPIQGGQFAAGDFDEDGVLDLAFTDYVTTVLLGNGDGSFQPPLAIPGEERLPWLLVRDVNADTHLDLVMGSTGGGSFGGSFVKVRLGDGTGAFPDSTQTLVGQSITGLDAGDVDGDGDLDLLVSQRELSGVAFLENDGTGTYTLPAVIGTAWQYHDGTYADVSGDGIGDLVGVYSTPPGGFGTAFLTMVRGINFRPTSDAPGAMPVATSSRALVLSAPSPNPARRTLRAELTVRDAGAVRVEVFDALGRRLRVLHDEVVAAGARVPLVLDAAPLPAGVYTVRATAGDASAVRRVTVVR